MIDKSNKYNEPFVSENQEKLFILMKDIAQKIEKQISDSREKAVRNLLNSNITSNQKKKSIQEYFDYHMSPQNIVTTTQNGSQYCLLNVLSLAKELYNDKTFPYGDSDFVLDCLAFWEDSFNFDDEILAYHLYRIDKSNKNLSCLVYVVGIYLSRSLGISFDEINKFDTSFLLSQKEAIKALNHLLVQVKNTLKKYKEHIPFFNQKYVLTDNDYKLSFSDQIDFDAAVNISKSIISEPDPFFEKYHGYPEPQKADEEIEREQHEIIAEHDLKMLSQSIRSIYLLSAIINSVGKEHFDVDILSISTICRRMCDQLFNDDEYGLGAFEIISKDKRINDSQFEAEESQANAISKEETFCSFLDLISDEIHAQNSIDTILRKRNEWMICAKASLKNETFEKIEHLITLPISSQLIKLSSSNKSLEYYKNKVKMLIGEHNDLLEIEIVNTLATAELLYDEYAIQNPSDEFDYSGISTLYYQALEGTYNSLFWRKYSNYLNSLLIDDCSLSSLIYKKDYRSEGYFPKYKGNIQNTNYVEYEKAKKQYTVKKHCMFGPFSILLDEIKNDNNEYSNFINYFADCIGYKDKSDMFDDKEFINRLNCFRTKFKHATESRNNASHGTDPINREQCTKDKLEIISEDRENNIGLIIQFLQLFNRNQA